MLDMIDKELDNLLTNTKMDYNIPMTAFEIMEKLGLKSKDSFKDNYLNPALDNELIKMTLSDKPTSKNPMYYED